jgi:hypothetical protein
MPLFCLSHHLRRTDSSELNSNSLHGDDSIEAFALLNFWAPKDFEINQLNFKETK